MYRFDLAEHQAKIERSEEKLLELDAQRLENLQAIEDADRKLMLHKSSTRAEVFRLKGAYNTVVQDYCLILKL